jgi:hypothetical protein
MFMYISLHGLSGGKRGRKIDKERREENLKK